MERGSVCPQLDPAGVTRSDGHLELDLRLGEVQPDITWIIQLWKGGGGDGNPVNYIPGDFDAVGVLLACIFCKIPRK